MPIILCHRVETEYRYDRPFPLLPHNQGLRALSLEGNGIEEIQGLENSNELRCLFLQQNLISSIQGLETLVDLDTLNVSNNQIEKIEVMLKERTTSVCK